MGLALLFSLAAARELLVGHEPLLCDPWGALPQLGLGCLLALDEINALLVPFAGLLAFLVALFAPRSALRLPPLRRLAAATAVTIATLATHDPTALGILWGLAMIPVWSELHAHGDGRAARVFAIYMLPSLLAMGGGVFLIVQGGTKSAWGAALVMGAVLIRKGIVPFHSWMPHMFENASLGTSTLFSAPQVGAYVAVRLVTPSAPGAVLLLAASAALITSVYGAGAALVQRNARRTYAFQFMSQSALVLVGLDCMSTVGLSGGLVWWLASGLALTGFGATLWLLEARRGQTDLAGFHGGYERMPFLAASFLMMGLASVGFPGTLGFVGAELLVDGAVTEFPHVGFLVVLAGGLNAIAVLRLYFILFCGARTTAPMSHRLRRREHAGVAVLILLLVSLGVYPQQLLASRSRAAVAILDLRARTRALISPAPSKTDVTAVAAGRHAVARRQSPVVFCEK